jgi:lipopolysaccharide transport system ATP-binding protein
MRARLAFAVAAQLQPDILLVDEVLAVGDLAFQRKCIAHLLAFVEGGGALILVSHSPHQVQAVCRRGLVLESGRCTFEGTAVEAASRHLEAQRSAYVPGQVDVGQAPDPVMIGDLLVRAPDGGEPSSEGPADIVIRFTSQEAYEAIVGISVWTADQMVCVAGAINPEAISIAPGPGEVRARIDRLPLTAGGYTLGAIVVDQHTLQPLGMVGFQSAPRTLTVTDDPSVYSNGHAIMRQLTTLDVTWL